MSSKGSAKAQKTSARLAAVQVLYQIHLGEQDPKAALEEYKNHRAGKEMDGDILVTPSLDLLNNIVNGAQTRADDIKEIITKSLADGGRTQVEPLLDCILRAGVYELLAHSDIDTGIVINDYLNVTQSFYEGTETGLVNAVLDRVAKDVRG